MSRNAVRVLPIVGLLLLWPSTPVPAYGACTVPGTHATIQDALDDPSCDPILPASGTFNGDLSVNRSVTIEGTGIGTTILDGTGTAPVIGLDFGVPLTLNLRRLTVTGGGGPSCGGILIAGEAHTVDLLDVVVTRNTPDSDGGGLCSLDGTKLSLTRSAVSMNETNDSIGGIWHEGGTLTLIDSHVDDNEAGSNVGGLNVTDAVVTIEGSTIDGNEAGLGTGGGFFSGTESLTITDSSVSGNVADDFGGLNLHQPATLTRVLMDGNRAAGNVGGLTSQASITIADSAFTRNTATTGIVGGVQLNGSPASMANTTVSGNSAADFAGGIMSNEVVFTGTNLTVTENTADSDGNGGGNGGGIYFDAIPGEAVIRNTILWGNRDGSPGAEAPDCFSNGASGGSNIIGTLAGCAITPQSTDRVGVDPKLGPLSDNGGATPTHALEKGSPAIDQADASFAPQQDQRGLQRKAPDIGAYELVRCLKVPVNRIGTSGKDKLKGTSGPDGMLGLGGKDTLSGKGGKDGLCGGGGKDKLKGGGGKDRMKGQGGKDRCVGGGGNDKAVCEEETSI